MERKIAVVGLGYVGLPLALALSNHFEVIGFDINEDYCKIAKQRIKQETVGDFLSPKGESLIAINQN